MCKLRFSYVYVIPVGNVVSYFFCIYDYVMNKKFSVLSIVRFLCCSWASGVLIWYFRWSWLGKWTFSHWRRFVTRDREHQQWPMSSSSSWYLATVTCQLRWPSLLSSARTRSLSRQPIIGINRFHGPSPRRPPAKRPNTYWADWGDLRLSRRAGVLWGGIVGGARRGGGLEVSWTRRALTADL